MAESSTSCPATTVSPQQHFLDLPPPSSHVEVSCADEWEKANEMIGKSVYGLCWLEHYLIGCTSSGKILIWEVDDQEQEEPELFDTRNEISLEDDDDEEEEKRPKKQPRKDPPKVRNRHPIVSYQASNSVLYSIQEIMLPTTNVIATCGADGIVLYTFNDLLSLQGNPSAVLEPLQTYKPLKSPAPVAFNDFCWNDDLTQLYAASGDGFGCYKWDTDGEKLLKTYPSAKKQPLHSVKVLPASTTAGGHSILLIGGEDGSLGVWDHRQDQLIENIDVRSAMNDANPLLTSCSTPNQGFTKWHESTKLHISDIATPSESTTYWNIVGGGSEYSSDGGFVACWHGATRSLASGTRTRSIPNSMAFGDNDVLMTVGNEQVVSSWSRTTTQRQGRSWCTTPCGHAIKVREDDGLTAIGGVGPTVDIFESFGNKLYSVTIQDAKR